MNKRTSNREADQTPRLYQKNELRRRMRRAYYDILNEDPDFTAALRDLCQRVQERLPSSSAWLAPRPASEIEPLVDAFAERWALPDDGPIRTPDLWETLRGLVRGGPLELQEAVRGTARHLKPTPTFGLAVARVDDTRSKLVDVDGTRVMYHGLVGQRVVVGGPVIWPFVPLPFVYDPRVDHPAQLRDYAKQVAEDVRQNIIAQAEAWEQQIEAEEGWGRMPPRHHDPDELRRMALRLYRRAVLRWSWRKIARAEYPPDMNDSIVPTRGVRKTVEAWAEELDIRLQ